jgi:uncharacterized protein YndB with AHSA1/START domain
VRDEREAPNGAAPEQDYSAELTLAAPPALVFSAIATSDGLASWWTPIVSGSLAPGSRFELGFPDSETTIELRVERARPPTLVEWTCLGHSERGEWRGTILEFRLSARGFGATALSFRHAGLDRRLGCFGDSERDWDRVLTDLRETVETDGAPPFADLNAAA